MPHHAAAWIDARPSLRVGWLEWRNAARRWPLAAAGLALLLTGFAALGRRTAAGQALMSAAHVPFVVGGVTGAACTMGMLRRARRLANERHRDWLAALPSDLSPTARAVCAPLLVWGAAMCVIVITVATAGAPVSACARLILDSAGGCAAALALVALVLAGEARRSRGMAGVSPDAVSASGHVAPASRYAIVRRPRRRWATRASLVPLGFWPVAHARFLDRPKVRARSIVLLLLGVPLGVAGAVVLAAAVVWLIALHLVNLLIGVIRVAFAASWWLGPTPVGAVRFAAAVTHRALAAQIAACALLLGMVYAIEGPGLWRAALARVAAGLAAVCVVSAVVCVTALRTGSITRSVWHRWIR